MTYQKYTRLAWDFVQDYAIAQREVMKAHREAMKAKPRSRLFRKIYDLMMDWEDSYLLIKKYNKHDGRRYA